MTRATVKWFNPNKGFGFVALEDGSGDAFLHVSVLERSGRTGLSEGEVLDCEISEGEKGLQVDGIQSTQPPSMTSAAHAATDNTILGTVKWFNPAKGFGFIEPDDGGKDVFVHTSALQRSNVHILDEGQRVRAVTSAGQKGPQVDSLEVL